MATQTHHAHCSTLARRSGRSSIRASKPTHLNNHRAVRELKRITRAYAGANGATRLISSLEIYRNANGYPLPKLITSNTIMLIVERLHSGEA